MKHSDILYLVRMFVHGLDSGGVCNGFTSMWIQALLTSKEDEERFLARFDYLDTFKDNKGNFSTRKFRAKLKEVEGRLQNSPQSPLSEEEYAILDIRAMCEFIGIHQNPINLHLHELFKDPATNTKPYLNQDFKETIYPLSASKKMQDNEIKFNIFDVGPIGGSKEQCFEYFENIRKLLIKEETKGTTAFLVGSNSHAVGIAFDSESNTWKFLDINMFGDDDVAEILGLSKITTLSLSSKELVAHLFICLSCKGSNLVMESKAITTVRDNELKNNLEDARSTLYQQFKSKPIITKFFNYAMNFFVDKEKAKSPQMPVSAIGYNFLMAACRSGQVELIDELSQYYDIDACTDDGWTALLYAVQSGRVEVVEKLLSQDPKPNINHKNTLGNTALMQAITHENIKIIKTILNSYDDIDLEQTTKHNLTLLMLADMCDNIEILKILLPKLPESVINTSAREGYTVLDYAIKKGDTEKVKLLMENHIKPDVNGNSGERVSSVLTALYYCKWNEAKIIFDNAEDIDPNLQDEHDNTMLMLAIKYNNIYFVNRILQLNKDIDFEITDNNGLNTADIAKQSGNYDIVRLINQTMVDQGKDPIVIDGPPLTEYYSSNPNKRKDVDSDPDASQALKREKLETQSTTANKIPKRKTKEDSFEEKHAKKRKK